VYFDILQEFNFFEFDISQGSLVSAETVVSKVACCWKQFLAKVDTEECSHQLQAIAGSFPPHRWATIDIT